MRKRVAIAILTIGALFSFIAGCASDAADGAILFKRERCIYCHSFKGRGAHIGPDLTDVTKRRSDDWIRDQISNPRLHYPNPLMPNHEYLSRRQINDLLKYLKS